MADAAGSSAAGTSTHRYHGIVDPPALEAKHKIFLSHSGAQKAFVKQLCLDLERNDRHPFFDIRRDSLPVGENFPSLIFEAIKQCHVGVVVFSEEFFMSKWPMLELAAMVEAQKGNCDLKIIPVFLGLSRKQCGDEENRRRWTSKWCELARIDSRVKVEEWEAALKVFGPMNDISCVDHGLDEVQCREEIVEAICKFVPANTMNDDLYVQGKSRICEVICEKINTLQESPLYGVRVLGLYGVGGIGKTTACMALCNHFYKEFRGKVCHAKLENGNEMETIQDVVRRLINTKHGLEKGFNIDECRHLLRKNMGKERAFLAMDNVSDSQKTIEQASFYLWVGYGFGSIVIVTARSLDQLKGLKINESNCMEMPELKEAEARSLFLYHAMMDVKESNEKMIVQYVERCRFQKGDGRGYHYHPLALQVLGVHVGYNSEEWMVDVNDTDAFNQLRDGEEHPIFSILRKSFDALLREDQFLFMDAALFYPENHLEFWQFRPKGNYMFEWLGMIHKISVDDVKRQLLGLKRKSLIEDLGDGDTRISMHDLWRDFATTETTIGDEKRRHWMYEVYGTEVTHGVFGLFCGWKNLQRICLKSTSYYMVKEVNLDNCSNVRVLILVGLDMSNVELDLSGLKRLEILELGFGLYEQRGPLAIHGLGLLVNLVHLRWSNFGKQTLCVEEIGNLTNLQVLFLKNAHPDAHGESKYKLPDLEKLVKLQEIELHRFIIDTSVQGLNSKLTRLRYLKLYDCENLRTCHGLGDLVMLVELDLSKCTSLEELPNLQKLKNLQILYIIDCHLISSIPGLDDLVHLRSLAANGCEKLDRLPNLSQLTNLQWLDVDTIPFQKVLGLGTLTSLKSLRVGHLQELATHGWIQQRSIPIFPLGNLINLKIYDCKGMDDLLGLESLTRLQTLWLIYCDFKDLSSLKYLTTLEDLQLCSCGKLEIMLNMYELTRLNSIVLFACGKIRRIFDPIAMDVSRGVSFNHIGLSSLQLQYLDCDGLMITDLPDLSNFPNLRSLTLCTCRNLTTLTSTGPLAALEDVFLLECPNLRVVPQFKHSKRLRIFKVQGCGVPEGSYL